MISLYNLDEECPSWILDGKDMCQFCGSDDVAIRVLPNGHIYIYCETCKKSMMMYVDGKWYMGLENGTWKE